MKLFSPGRKGVLSVEYALLLSLVVAALVAMSVYFVKTLSGKWRETGDTFGFGRQYEPGVTTRSP